MADFNTRLTILSKAEIEDLYALPQLNDDERKRPANELLPERC